MQNTQTLIGQIDRIIYSEETFFIGALKSGEKISGHYYESDVEAIKGSAITLSGFYEEHKKFGKTFKFDSLKVNQNELFFFLNKVIKGFSKKLSADVIEKFGQEGLIEILDKDIEQLLDVPGIKEKRLKKIQASWKQFRSMRELGEFLAPLGVTAGMITTIATALKDVNEPIEKLKSNPYILTSIHGIGFKRADEIALKMGLERESEKRLASAMEYLLYEQCEQDGHTVLHKDKLFILLDELLFFSAKNHLYEGILIDKISEQSIVMMQENRLSPSRLYHAEKNLFNEFKRRAKIKNSVIIKNLDQFLKKSDLKLGDEQLQAAKIINEGSNILFLVGYAGTGKSTTSRTILEILNSKYDTSLIMTCALSGIASQRIADTTGFESSTIQSLLVKFEERDCMPYQVLLIDEASMINSSLFARLIAKVDRDAILIIVGDDAQLPPIGAGNILSDVLSLEIAPTIKLTKIYRQNEDQAIALIANDIRQSKVPYYRNSYEDFEFVDVSISNYYALKQTLSNDELINEREKLHHSILSTIISNASMYVDKTREFLKKKEILNYLNYYQVIAPMKSGTLGVDNLNAVLQDFFNPISDKSDTKRFVKKGEKEFRLFDKVVHIKNENMVSWTSEEFKNKSETNERRIFNGMSGMLFKIDNDEEQAYVFYPNEDVIVRYEFSELKSHLMLSYALTIHKVQGMEYSVVVMPMTFSHYIMHNTKLLYTAITRAKSECYVIGESQAFENACRRSDNLKRDTVLLELGKKSG